MLNYMTSVGKLAHTNALGEKTKAALLNKQSNIENTGTR